MEIKSNEEILNLIKEACAGNKKAYEELYGRYKKAIRGYISSRYFYKDVRAIEKERDIDSRIRAIEQDTWIAVWEKISTYEAARASFYKFICFWADIMVKRYFSKKREINFSAFEQEDSGQTAEEIIDNISFEAQDFPSDEFLSKCEQFLKATFSEGGPPHQLLSFGFSKLISGWGPQEIVQKLSPVLLQKLTNQLIVSYKEESLLPDYAIKDCFGPLENKMAEKVKDALEDETSRGIYAKLLNAFVADTFLENYYGKDPEHNISDWSNKVGKRVLKLLNAREK
ncbi:MAG: hypothetical protein WC546_03635 [Candidatus Omnitrophota bacterium]